MPHLNTFQKNILFAIGATAACAILVCAGVGTYSHIRNARAQAKAKETHQRIEQIMALNRCGHFTDGERARLDKVQDDPEATRRVLLEIHNDRVESWSSNYQLAQAVERECLARWRASGKMVDYSVEIQGAREEQSRALDNYRSFSVAVENIKQYSINTRTK